MHQLFKAQSYTIGFLAFAIAALAIPDPLAAQPAPSVPSDRTITVSGEGEVKAVPDEAVLSTGVVSVAPTATAALAANRRAMNAVFDELKRQGIPDKSIQTSEFNVSPQYDFSRSGNSHPRITGYQVSNNVSVTLDDLTKLGPAIDALVNSGANSMSGISFTLRDPKPFLKQAREAAIRDAMDRAETDARASGVTLGPVTQINEGETQMPRAIGQNRMMAGYAAPTPIAAGEETIAAQVSMTFEIK